VKTTTVKKSYVAAAALMMILGLAGCSTGGDATPVAAPDGNSGDDATGTEEGNDGREFDSTDDAVVTAVKAALEADDVKWEGKALKAYFNEGSVSDTSATIGCLAMQSLIAEDEVGFVVYPDGDFDCSTKHPSGG
jgi:hypothetical protein